MATNMLNNNVAGNAGAGMMQPQYNQQNFTPQNTVSSTSNIAGNTSNTDQASKDVFCSNCAKKFSANHKFCPHCGDPYDACPKCGTDNDKSAKRCISCGTGLQSDSIGCSNCNNPIVAGASFCVSCGKPQGDDCSSP